MSTRAFQLDAFQNNAFQVLVDGLVVSTPVGLVARVPTPKVTAPLFPDPNMVPVCEVNLGVESLDVVLREVTSE